ncbi:MAG: hypothetical protein OXF27_03895 [Acidobacteria bacterium]|nr:hypothetical protein [Acidobacteriota bacterium]
MQRPLTGTSSTQWPGRGSSSPTPSRAAASSSWRCFAGGARSGIFPSGGSMMSDVRRVPMMLVPKSIQNWL